MTITPGFTGATLDRADRLRNDECGLAAARADPRARLLALDGLEPLIEPNGRLGWTSLAAAGSENDLVLLGLDDGVPCFAELQLDRAAAVDRSMGVMQRLAQLPAADAALYAGARSVVDWHYRHRFCANCGAPTVLFRAGWGRRCKHCHSEHFPRVDPVVIMLAEYGDRVLLGRQPVFPPRFYSALAGFVEPGESLEEAVRRELFEEVGLQADAVRYVLSQPWPFPSSLMIGCIAEVTSDVVVLDIGELDGAIWVDRGGVEAALAAAADATFVAPPPVALAFSLLKTWLMRV
ncbi:MAG: NAD(+) diphosphatase [Pseudomonadales bacterium]|jgi:NAD+ diphosphatase|nr:NAD(+) diphosphatase [Pseudomonadales bacterium]MCP5337939.1 NAD(+) diphosphatase [Pseudomonadales bacterium]